MSVFDGIPTQQLEEEILRRKRLALIEECKKKDQTIKVICPLCKGSGQIALYYQYEKTCEICDGAGSIQAVRIS